MRDRFSAWGLRFPPTLKSFLNGFYGILLSNFVTVNTYFECFHPMVCPLPFAFHVVAYALVAGQYLNL
jgi:hypothetical protein